MPTVESPRLVPNRNRSATQRVRLVLAALYAQHGAELRVTQAQVAREADCTRETVSRELSRLANQSVIKRGYGRLLILRPEVLK